MNSVARYAVLVACGCNQFYGLESTRLPYDALVVGCPEGRAPRFSPAIHQAVQQDCSQYHFNADASLATALCRGYPAKIFVGRRDEMLELQVVPVTPTSTFYFSAHPAPASRRIYMQKVVNGTPTTHEVVTFDEMAEGAWIETGKLPIPFTNAHRKSSVFRGATGDRLIVLHLAMDEMIEYEREGTSWVQRGPTRLRPTMFNGSLAFSLTTDGLRAVYLGEDRKTLLYVSRPDLDSWFGDPLPLEGAPAVEEAQLTEDCARLYYNGLDSIFYSEQG
ncbi:MAG: hypothetical protein M4D80_13140 [Myxococcota bacterium]|nr:hypothetical protein [Myxococcota bacterium]